MAPERIACAEAGPYSIQSDIWSLGLSLVETALGQFPYEKHDNVFAQLHAIVDGPVPELPRYQFSDECRDFVACCLRKNPMERPSYGELLEHPFIQFYEKVPVETAAWAKAALNWCNKRKK